MNFTFGMIIKVVAGFYIGCTGMVVGHHSDLNDEDLLITDLDCTAENGADYSRSNIALSSDDVKHTPPVKETK